MPCNQGNYSPIEVYDAVGPRLPGPILSSDDRVLVVSNAPETVGRAEFESITVPKVFLHHYPTLYKCAVPLLAGAVRRFRVFIWHVNETGATKSFSVRASLSAVTTATVTQFLKQDAPNSPFNNIAAVGICLAKVQLYRSFGAAIAKPSLSSTETTLWTSGGTANKNMCCALLEFNVTAAAACDLRLRITSDDGTSTSWSSPVASAEDDSDTQVVHVRGWWPQSTITLPFHTATIDANPNEVRQIYVGVNETENPTELSPEGFGWQGATTDPEGTPSGNDGLYGVNATYRFTATNSHPTTSHAIYARLIMRNNNTEALAKFWGAAWVSLPADPARPKKGIPVIRSRSNPMPPPDFKQDWVKLDENAAALVPPLGSRVVEITVATGGGGALPVNLWVTNLGTSNT